MTTQDTRAAYAAAIKKPAGTLNSPSLNNGSRLLNTRSPSAEEASFPLVGGHRSQPGRTLARKQESDPKRTLARIDVSRILVSSSGFSAWRLVAISYLISLRLHPFTRCLRARA